MLYIFDLGNLAFDHFCGETITATQKKIYDCNKTYGWGGVLLNWRTGHYVLLPMGEHIGTVMISGACSDSVYLRYG